MSLIHVHPLYWVSLLLGLICFVFAVLVPPNYRAGDARLTDLRARLIALGLFFWLLPAVIDGAR